MPEYPGLTVESPMGSKRRLVLWAPPRSGFTLLMEAMMVLLSQTGMAVAEAFRTLRNSAPAAARAFLARGSSPRKH
jgi:hypothetical protein